MQLTKKLLFASVSICLGGLLSSVVAQTASAPSGKPTLYVVGDSTVKNGRDTGSGNQWGWGHILPAYFDLSKINVVNNAVGGTSSRSFFQSPNLWPKTLAKVQPGDFVMMQFGHNDNTAPPEKDTTRFRSTIKGNGEETVQGPTKDGGMETIHSFGWYIRQFIAQTEAKGATPIVCSLIPRNSWKDGKINRADASYGLWAQQAVEQANKEADPTAKVKAFFLPLNTIIADHYDQMGEEAVKPLFPSAAEHTHTDWAGAKLNAQSVAEGVKSLSDSALTQYLAATPADINPPTTAP